MFQKRYLSFYSLKCKVDYILTGGSLGYGYVVCADMLICYSQTGMFDILIVTVINWIVGTIMAGQVVPVCN